MQHVRTIGDIPSFDVAVTTNSTLLLEPLEGLSQRQELDRSDNGSLGLLPISLSHCSGNRIETRAAVCVVSRVHAGPTHAVSWSLRSGFAH